MTDQSAAVRPTAGNTPTPRRAFRRHRTWAILAAVFVAALVLTAVLQLQPRGDRAALSTRNAAPEGARATAEILGRHGVAVEQQDSLEGTARALEAARRAGSGTTVLLYDRNGYLGREQLQQLREAADRLVVVTPRLTTLQGVGSGFAQAGVVRDGTVELAPACADADPAAAGSVSAADGFLYLGEAVCYPAPGGRGGLYARSADGRTVVLGTTAILSNRALAEHGNAALVLRTLGREQQLVWYLPGMADVAAAAHPVTLDELAPPWTRVIGPWLAFVAVLAMLWRGRRLGPLVFEPIPVVVKAVETAEGRARLYHDAGAVDRAADVLRAGSLVRLARALRLGPEAGAAVIVEAAARHLGRTPESVAAVVDDIPRSETGLVHFAERLDRLEKEVHAR
ncbi:DUF4350 domain-containing protein [Arthrobacter sp. Soil763]|uniref:DUF4350 domain-containing protein n=1 Tax=Arthrobacter sp. Soil763 TaxID=1736402 RepID=UPI0006FFBF37|nr:DUF4350 domain-containing protein [Arthrobacter sp. Soil763]KRE79878.1 hypothetical protein ASG71_07500 [Arthrobacter sp. Soil763]